MAGLAVVVSPGFAETLDRIAVSVGHEVITESEVIMDLRVAAFMDGKPVDLSGAAKRQVAERLVDQLLILREAADSHVTLPSVEATTGLVEPYAADSSYKADLQRYGISERDLGAHLLAGLRTLTFTDLRFRPDVQVSDEDIRGYYDKLPNSAAAPKPSFEESRDQIEKLLIERGVDEALDQWLAAARKAANIRYRDKAFE
jgi:parvulin-like peptidyl-prolyl isomerase